MLHVTIPEGEMFDEAAQEFIRTKERTLQLEHSLVSISKWESIWHRPFLGKDKKSFEETLDYVKCMTITQNVSPETYLFLTQDNIDLINEYIENPMTASSVPDTPSRMGNRENITSELVYYWMIALNIPFECQKWHLNRLLMLIKVCNFKNTPPKKMSTRDLLSRNAALNAARKQQFNTKG